MLPKHQNLNSYVRRQMKDQVQKRQFAGFLFGIKWLLVVLLVVAAYVGGRNSIATNLMQANNSLEAAKVKLAESNTLLEIANGKLDRIEKRFDMQRSELTAGDLWNMFSEGHDL